MDKLAAKVNWHHATIEGSYFAAFSAIWGFGPVLLLYLGLSNSMLGMITSLALLLPLLVQPCLAALSDADRHWTSRRLALALSVLTLAASVVMTLYTGEKTVLLVCYILIGVSLVSTAPFFNSMVMAYHLRGVNVNYGLGRGTGSATYALVALVLGDVLERRAPTVILPVLLSTYNMMICRSAMEAVPQDLYENASLEGASEFYQLLRIAIPLVKPTLAVLTLYYAVARYNDFFNGVLYLGDQSLQPLQMFLRKILLMASSEILQKAGSTGAAAAAQATLKIRYVCIVLATIPIFCITPFVQKYLVTGTMLGAVKG